MKLDKCPHCESDQRGAPIPAKYFVHEADCPLLEGEYSSCFCLPYGDMPEEERFFSRTILVEIWGVYDGGLFYQCPDCEWRWHRWPVGSDLRLKAEPYVAGEAKTVITFDV